MTLLDISLWIGAVLWLLLAAHVLCNWILLDDLAEGPPPPPPPPTPGRTFVSIVVPARNEERCIRRAVTSFCSQDYPNYEVVVVDDCSTDATGEILAELQKSHKHLKVVRGREPPDGWLGKVHALEMGRREAEGDWLLFVDADVVYGPDLLRRAIDYADERGAEMLFLWPRLLTAGVLEAALMSSLYLVGLALIPVYLIRRPQNKLFAIGGGCFNLVRREALQASGAFDSIRNEIVDDVGLGYAVKRAGRPIGVALAGSLIQVRMYAGARETIKGFSKNVYPMMRTKPWRIPLAVLAGLELSMLPYVGLLAGWWDGEFCVPAAVSLFFMHLVMGLLAVVFRQPWYIAFLNPVGEFGWWVILLRSYVVYRRKGVLWRGRTYGSST